jgi:hypothetical protein
MSAIVNRSPFHERARREVRVEHRHERLGRLHRALRQRSVAPLGGACESIA